MVIPIWGGRNQGLAVSLNFPEFTQLRGRSRDQPRASPSQKQRSPQPSREAPRPCRPSGCARGKGSGAGRWQVWVARPAWQLLWAQSLSEADSRSHQGGHGRAGGIVPRDHAVFPRPRSLLYPHVPLPGPEPQWETQDRRAGRHPSPHPTFTCTTETPPTHASDPHVCMRHTHTHTHIWECVPPPSPLGGSRTSGGIGGSISCGFGAATWMSVAWPWGLSQPQ